MEIDVKKLQEDLLVMFQVLHNICEENNISYYMLGGTCLGARRHNGFIPWDDDIDIGIPRKDYDRLCSIAEKVLPNGYEFRYYKTDKKSPIHYVKMINSNTTLIENSYRNYVEGIYIDIFPLDGVKNIGSFREKIRMKKIWLLHAMIMNYGTTQPKSSVIKSIFKWWSKKHNINKLHNKVEKLMTTYSIEDCDNIANFLGAYNIKEVNKKKIFGVPTKYKFEKKEFYGPEKIDEYLTELYDDFMELPPIEKRVCKHNYYYINLKLPYKDYLNNLEKRSE